MALAPLPASNTKRYFFRTVCGAFAHFTQVRVQDSVDNAAALAAFQNDLLALRPAFGSNVVIDELLVAEHGSDIRNPVAGWTLITGTGGVAISGQNFSRSFSLRGRSATGRKVKLLMWGFINDPQPDFQLAVADQLPSQITFQATVQTRASYYLAIDGSKPDWRTDYLEDYNDHWEKELRP
jgi:hypothetical protein